MRICSACGTELNGDVAVCPSCGTSVEVETTDKVLWNSINKKLFYGLSWIFSILPFISWVSIVANIIVLCADSKKLTVHEKRSSVSLFVMILVGFAIAAISGFCAIPYIGWVLAIVVVPVAFAWGGYVIVASIISAVKAFKGFTYQIPGMYQLASLFVKE